MPFKEKRSGTERARVSSSELHRLLATDQAARQAGTTPSSFCLLVTAHIKTALAIFYFVSGVERRRRSRSPCRVFMSGTWIRGRQSGSWKTSSESTASYAGLFVSPFLSYFLSTGFIETIGSSSLCVSWGFWRYRDMRFSGERGVRLCCRGSCNGCNL